MKENGETHRRELYGGEEVGEGDVHDGGFSPKVYSLRSPRNYVVPHQGGLCDERGEEGGKSYVILIAYR